MANPPTYADFLPDPLSGETKESLDARRIDSKFSNRLHVIVSGGIARITFGEMIRPGETNWHSSVTLTAYDALRLSDLIFVQDDADRARYAPRATTQPAAAAYETEQPPSAKPDESGG